MSYYFVLTKWKKAFAIAIINNVAYHKELLQEPSDRADLRIGCHHFFDENLQSNHVAKKGESIEHRAQ